MDARAAATRRLRSVAAALCAAEDARLSERRGDVDRRNEDGSMEAYDGLTNEQRFEFDVRGVRPAQPSSLRALFFPARPLCSSLPACSSPLAAPRSQPPARSVSA